MTDFPIIAKLIEKLQMLKARFPTVDVSDLLKLMELEILLKEAMRNK